MKLLSRNKKAAEETKPKDQVKAPTKDEVKPQDDSDKPKPKIQGYGTQPKLSQKAKEKRGFFGRKKKDKKKGFLLPTEKQALKKLKDEPAKPTDAPPIAEIKTEEPKYDHKVAEEKKEEAPPAPAEQPKQEQPVIPETVHSDSNEGDDDEASQAAEKPQPPTPRTDDADEAPKDRSPRDTNEAEEAPKMDKEEEEGPQEPEGRNEEAEGEPAEKNTASLSREGTERTDNSKMSIEEPHDENPGLLCGCI